MRRVRFTLLTRPGCHLCEEFEEQLLAEFGERLEVDGVRVDAHPQWLADYGLRIPVLLSETGEFVCEMSVDAGALGRWL